MLLSNGSTPTAFSIAVLALEEAAKAVQWWRLVTDRNEVDVSVPNRSHMERLREVHRTWHLLDALLAVEEDPDAEAPDVADTERAINEAIRSDNVRKQRGFYVDVKGNDVLEPGRISREDAEEIIRLAETYISMRSAVARTRAARPVLLRYYDSPTKSLNDGSPLIGGTRQRTPCRGWDSGHE
jgi:AbiV family abortive infection protein